MPYAHIPENIEKLDSTKKISINELQTAYKNKKYPGALFRGITDFVH